MSTLKGIFPDSSHSLLPLIIDATHLLEPMKQKNFIHENVKNLRRMEQLSRLNKGVEEIKKSQLYQQRKIGNKHGNSSARMSSTLSIKKHESNDKKLISNNKKNQEQELCTKSSSEIFNESNTCEKKMLYSISNDNSAIKSKKEEHNKFHKTTVNLHKKALLDPNISYKSVKGINNKSKMQIKLKSQGIQTLDTEQIDKLYSEGTIRYPSKKCLNYDNSIDKTEINQQIDKTQTSEKHVPLNQENVHTLETNVLNKNDLKNSKLLSPKMEIDITKLNKQHTSVPSKIGTRIHNNNHYNNNDPPVNYRKGVVPKYIKNRKEIQEKEQKMKAELLDANCPNGHVLLPDHERKETLRVLKKSYQDYVNDLNMMPIVADTLKAQRRKAEIEKQLNKLEEGIKVFSKPKVYVKMNA